MSQLSFLDKLIQQRNALKVSEVTARIKDLIEAGFADIWVEGEISNLTRHSSGHWYFTLKDDASMLRCACFRMQNRLIRFEPEDGMSVRARGRLSVYEPRGEYQLVVANLEPVGIGSLQIAFEQLRARLAAEGLFDEERKRRLPMLPRLVGVVTSPTGAVIRDIVKTLRRRDAAVDVLIVPARVQGDGSSRELVRALDFLNRRGGVDVIILARGGGSIEDLWAFNEEVVARAIERSNVPVISAVGHETDFTIADFVADMRASTPSAAAEIVVAARDELSRNIQSLANRMNNFIRYRLLELRNRLHASATARVMGRMPARIGTLSQRIDDAFHHLETSIRSSVGIGVKRLKLARTSLERQDVRRAVESRRRQVEASVSGATSAIEGLVTRGREKFLELSAKLSALSPLEVLARGYAIAFNADGAIIKRAIEVQPGERLRLRLHEGEIDCIRELNEPPHHAK